MKSLFDHDRQPVVIEDQPGADPFEWLAWIVDNHPYVTEEGQAVLIDGALLIRLADRPPLPDGTLVWSLQAQVYGDAVVQRDGRRPTFLVEVMPDGSRRRFYAPVPVAQYMGESRLLWTGPHLLAFVEELREAALCG